jgi:hypothetical protein
MTEYEQGKIKVVWLEDNPRQLHSQMFPDLDSARRFAHDLKDYLIFSLVSQENMEKFTWQLLPYGNYSLYQKLFRLYRQSPKGIIRYFLKT